LKARNRPLDCVNGQRPPRKLPPWGFGQSQ
jgi:hypothetical protein